MYTRTQTLRTRRTLVVVRTTLFIVGLLFWILLLGQPWHALVLSIIAAAHAFLSFFSYYKNPLWRLANAPADRLDEREVQVRAVAYVDAFRLLALITVLMVVWADVAKQISTDMVATSATSYMVVLFFSMLLTLPADCLAWREREV